MPNYLKGLLALLLLLLLMLMTMTINHQSLTLPEVFGALMFKGTLKSHLIIWDIRMPRFIIVVLVGFALAISGCVFQTITRNHLAEPGLLGVNSGSLLSLILFLLFFKATLSDVLTVVIMPLFSFIGGIIVSMILLLLMRNRQINSSNLIMNGLAINAFFSAVIIIATIKLNESQLDFYVAFSAGTIYGTSWIYVYLIAPLILVCSLLIYSRNNQLNILSLEPVMQQGLGIKESDKYWLIILATLLSSISVAVAGGISIVGLLAPHIARLLVGASHKKLIPLAAVIGSLLVAFSDLLSKYILSSTVPTGIILIILCTPYLLYNLSRKRRLL